MKRWKEWSLILGCLTGALALLDKPTGYVLGREIRSEEMSQIVGGGPLLGTDRCQNACNSTTPACDATKLCYVPGGYVNPGDRCTGGGGGAGFVYNCIGVAPWQLKCSLGGADTKCSPTLQCIWTLNPVPAATCASLQQGTCAGAAVVVDESGKSSCTNVPASL